MPDLDALSILILSVLLIYAVGIILLLLFDPDIHL